MALALLGVPLVVDPTAEAAFDSPKRLLALLTIGVAAGAHLLWPTPAKPRSWGSLVPRLAATLAASVVAWAVVSALLSPRRSAAMDSARALLLYTMLLPLGAGTTLRGGLGRLLLTAFLAASAVNAVVSWLQGAGALRLFSVEMLGGRQDTGALLGNEGHLALTLALACVAAMSLVFDVRRPALRAAISGVLVVSSAALALNRNLTALTALAAGTAALLGLRLRRRALLPLSLAVLAATAAALLVAPLRQRAAEAWADARAGSWDRLLTYRLGPWAAALEMIRERPLLGWGPGSFGAEFVPHRLSAEIRYRTRFLNPTVASTYSQAHCEYLQLAAEAGVPAALGALGAAGLLFAGAIRVALGDGPSAHEASALVGVLVTGAVAALTWFPLQQTASAVPLLLAAGRAWMLAAEDGGA